MEITRDSRLAKVIVDDSMCVDVCVHDTGEGNSHAHIMAIVKPLNPDCTGKEKLKKNIYVSETVSNKSLPPRIICAEVNED